MYIIALLTNLLPFLKNYDVRKTNYDILVRKYYFPRRLIIYFENMIFAFENMSVSMEVNRLASKIWFVHSEIVHWLTGAEGPDPSKRSAHTSCGLERRGWRPAQRRASTRAGGNGGAGPKHAKAISPLRAILNIHIYIMEKYCQIWKYLKYI